MLLWTNTAFFKICFQIYMLDGIVGEHGAGEAETPMALYKTNSGSLHAQSNIATWKTKTLAGEMDNSTTQYL